MCTLALASVAASVHAASAQSVVQPVVKIAYFNIQSGKGEPGLPGRPVLFYDNTNCTDSTQPLNGWGVGFVQKELIAKLSDPSMLAVGLTEAWSCGSPENVRNLLGWKARSTERNGVGLVARHGFAGPEQWLQLDTSMNPNPADTMWVLRVPVCLDAACTQSMPVYVSHWYSSGTYWQATYDKQAQQSVAFLESTSGGQPHVFGGDLNTWEGSAMVCNQSPNNKSLSYLRNAGYMDGWTTVNGGAEGFTGMTNRPGCGIPEGYAWKRIDYVWSKPDYLPIAMERFGVVPAGDPAPSDHYGIIATFPYPGTQAPSPEPEPDPKSEPEPPPATPSPNGDIVMYARRTTSLAGSWQIVDDATAAGGARVGQPDAGAVKVTAAAAAPANYFELTFTPEANRAYHLWVRGKAQNDGWANDSVYVQFSGSVTSTGAATYRIGTSSAATVNLEDGANVGVAGWGWQDNGYGLNVLGSAIYFDGTPQTLRVQTREDGFSIDQIVLSPVQYVTTAPGTTKNDTHILPETTAAPPTLPPAVWQTTANITINGDAVTKTGGCDGCADAAVAGATRVTDSAAYFQFTPTSGARMVIGFMAEDAAITDFRSMPYSFGLWPDGSWDIREANTYRTDGPGQTGDLFTIAVESSTVRFFRNGVLVYSTARPGGQVLRAGAVLLSTGATFTALRADVTAGTYR